MRLFILFTILFLKLSFGCFSQAPKPPRGTKYVIIEIDTTGGKRESLNRIARYLLERGMEVDEINHELGLVQTKDAKLKFAGWKYRISVLLTGSKARFSGKNVVDDVVRDIQNRGALGDIWVHSFDALNKAAIDYPHSHIEYLP